MLSQSIYYQDLCDTKLNFDVPFIPSLKDVACQCDLLNENTDELECYSLSILDALPIEIQYKILSYLTPRELCRSVAPVCKRWNQLANEPSLWQKLEFVSDVPINVVGNVLKRAPFIRKLELRNFGELWEVMPQLTKCEFLQSLDMRWCDGINARIMSLLVVHCPLIRTLNVEGCRLVDLSVIGQIVRWKKLKNLCLSHCTLIRNESILLIAEECRHLEVLNIDGLASISDSAALVLIEKRKSILKKLYLDGDELTDITYQSLIYCSNLTELSISFAELMSDVGLMALKELTSLQRLKVKRGSELSDDSLRTFFRGSNMQNLFCLDLSGCSNFDDVGVETMAKCCPLLKNLGLAWCWDISDRGLEAIVSSCKNLETLDLVGLVKITGSCLANIPYSLPNLVFLDLQQCSRIIDDIVEDVVRQMTDIKILNYYGEELSYETINARNCKSEVEDEAVEAEEENEEIFCKSVKL